MTTTILLDTNAYLRLAKRIQPLLGKKFNPAKDYVLVVLREVTDEVHRQPRLVRQYPWFDGPKYTEERKAHGVRLSKDQKNEAIENKKFLLSHVARNARAYLLHGRDPPGDTDCYVLGVAMACSWCVATDDENMHALGKDFEVKCLYAFDVLHKLLSADMIDKAKVIEIYEALEINGDLTARWTDAKDKLFKKIFGPGRAKHSD
ncbi:hypothetical protein [Stenotrophomonas humi]